MARGNRASEGRSARSEAGTLRREETTQSRIKRASEAITEAQRAVDNADALSTPQQEALRLYLAGNEAARILAGERDKKERYEIKLQGYDSLKPSGKLNLLEGTIDGKKIDTAYQDRGAFDRSGTKSRNSAEAAAAFNAGSEYANQDQGFIFAKDDNNNIFAIPHTWDTNDPQGTVGIFRGDRIVNTDQKGKTMNLQVIGTFDSSPRGLQLAAAASGDAIGRTNGIKQTATILAGSSGGKYTVESVVQGLKTVPSQIRSAVRGIQRGKGDNIRKLDPEE
jgi:hypothetical protein